MITWKRIDSVAPDETVFYFSSGEEGFTIVCAPGRFPSLYRHGILVETYQTIKAVKSAAIMILTREKKEER